MAFVHVNIGSNLGDRRLNISRAVRAISENFGPFEISHAVESDPWGFGSTNSFINVGVSFETELSPHDLLHKLQQIERKISPASHRNPDGSYADRLIDVDIIAIDDLVIDDEELKIPHPLMEKRRFVLEPMAEIAPGWRNPLNGKTPFEMLMDI